MELLLVRHALPDRVETLDRPADPGLSDTGRAQAERLADYLAREQIDAIYSSPMRRALETMGPLAGRLDLAIGVVDGVAEWDRDETSYVPVEELRASGDARFDDMTKGVWTDMAIMEPFSERVVAALDDLIAAHPGARIVVGCHAGVVNTFLGAVLGLPIDRRGFHYPNYTSIHRIAASRSGVRTIITVNETAHLRNTGLPMGLIQEG